MNEPDICIIYEPDIRFVILLLDCAYSDKRGSGAGSANYSINQQSQAYK